jgi:hypothetical protein
MSELLRTQQCVHQVHDRQRTDCEHNHRFQTHLSLPTLSSSLHALAEVHVRNRQAEKPDRNRDPKYVLHILPRYFRSAIANVSCSVLKIGVEAQDYC